MNSVNSPFIASSAKNLPTICVLCSHNCGLRVDVEEGKIVKVRPDKENPSTHGYSCNKAYSIPFYINHAQRVQQPLKRQQNGSYSPISWDQAISEIGTRLREIREQYSGNSIALAGVGGQGNHLDGVYALAFLKGLGSSWFFNAFAQEKTQHMLVDHWMMNAPPTVYLHADAANSQYVLMIGTNPVLSNRGRNATELIKALKEDPHRTLVVVDPRTTETTRRADQHLALRPGTDAFLLLGLARLIVDRGWENESFLKTHALDYEKLITVLQSVDPAEMADRCELEFSDLEKVAEGFAKAESACIFFDLGMEQIPYSTLASYLVRVLLALTGNLGQRGGNTFHATFSPNVMPFMETQQHRAPVSGIEGIPALGPFGMFSPNLLPEEIEADHPERIRAVIVEGSNPLLSYADSQRFRRAFEKLDLLVVIDPAMTETARIADYVLPTPVGYEKWEWSTFPNGYPEIYGQLRPPVVQGPRDALPEAEIYARLTQAVGLTTSPPAAFQWITKRLNPRRYSPFYQGWIAIMAVLRGPSKNKTFMNLTFLSYQIIGPHLPAPALASVWLYCHLFALTRRKDALRSLDNSANKKTPFALGELLFQKLLDHPQGVELAKLDEQHNLEEHCLTPSKKIHLAPETMLREIYGSLNDASSLNQKFPFILSTGERTQWNANTIQRDPSWRKGKGPHSFVRINPDDAKSLKICNHDWIQIQSAKGTIILPALVDDAIRPGCISAPHGFGMEYPDAETGELHTIGANLNQLTDTSRRDPYTGCPYHKHVPCRITPIAASAKKTA